MNRVFRTLINGFSCINKKAETGQDFCLNTFSIFSMISSGDMFFIQAKSPRMQGLLP